MSLRRSRKEDFSRKGAKIRKDAKKTIGDRQALRLCVKIFAET
jgi:hypothetical protein